MCLRFKSNQIEGKFRTNFEHKEMQQDDEENSAPVQNQQGASPMFPADVTMTRDAQRQLKRMEKLEKRQLIKCDRCPNAFYKNSQRAIADHRRKVHGEKIQKGRKKKPDVPPVE
jgi:cytochrome c-type biogenesis protein CcmH/NrfF